MLNPATARRTPLSVAEKARHSPALGAKIRFAFKKDGAARCPRRVIRDRVEPVASPTMSAIPPKAEDARRAIFASLAQETKLLARDHKNTFRFFVSISRDPWWGPSGPMAADRRRPRLSLAGVILFCPFARKNIVMVDDDTLVELWRRFLKDPRTSDAEIRRLSRLALLRYEDFRLQLIAWSLEFAKPHPSQRNNRLKLDSGDAILHGKFQHG